MKVRFNLNSGANAYSNNRSEWIDTEELGFTEEEWLDLDETGKYHEAEMYFLGDRLPEISYEECVEVN